MTTSAAARPTTIKQATAIGAGGAVASDTQPSTRAGLEVLERGGTAADAAVAVASTLGVTDPYVAGVGGGGYFVYYDARDRTVYTIDGRETAPAADDHNLFIDPSTGTALPFPTAVTSGLSVGVPGTLKTWQRALARFGRFNLAQDLRPAEHVAHRGFVIGTAVPSAGTSCTRWGISRSRQEPRCCRVPVRCGWPISPAIGGRSGRPRTSTTAATTSTGCRPPRAAARPSANH